jgi:hypothetical protein
MTADDRPAAHVIVFQNGMVAVCDADGEQIPELQGGPATADLGARIKARATDKTTWLGDVRLLGLTREELIDISPQAAGEFSVAQFFHSGGHELVAAEVGAEEAMRRVVSLINSIGGKIGTTRRVIIMDGLGLITFEWVFGEGVIFPTREDIGR